MTIPLTILISSFFASALACFYFLFVRRSHDSEYITLSAKYADAASLLTSMRAKVDDLQEKLDFSEDIRYGLGMDNARMAKRIEELERDAKKADEVRIWLMDQLNMVINDKWRLEDALKTTQRSLRIARHKEFKRWKKRKKMGFAESNLPWRSNDALSNTFISLHWVMSARIRAFLPYRDRDHASEEIAYGKKRCLEIIAKIRTMEPYPLP